MFSILKFSRIKSSKHPQSNKILVMKECFPSSSKDMSLGHPSLEHHLKFLAIRVISNHLNSFSNFLIFIKQRVEVVLCVCFVHWQTCFDHPSNHSLSTVFLKGLQKHIDNFLLVYLTVELKVLQRGHNRRWAWKLVLSLIVAATPGKFLSAALMSGSSSWSSKWFLLTTAPESRVGETLRRFLLKCELWCLFAQQRILLFNL